MDPNACLRRFLDACADEERHDAMEAICDLRDWIARGGFLPTVESDDCAPSMTDFSMPYYIQQKPVR